eukprot:TRINITY_DN16600_c0_g1_i1.p2 TRINITY_DN16600_c0_g1~~TRINITY_DN16600_c0_g1_i1.p2  ORF type:complete len:301 (+),score=88.36 TRINITY_DN16600_c0_g1_i1:77-904(+)
MDPADEATVVDLNVGGVPYTTSLATLRKHPRSALAQMFGEPFACHRDRQGRWFIDRNGALFEHVLDFLRDGALHGVLPHDGALLARVAAELAWYGLPHVTPVEAVLQQAPLAPGGALRTPPTADGAQLGGDAACTHLRLLVDARHAVCGVEVPASRRAAVRLPDTTILADAVEYLGQQGFAVAACGALHDAATAGRAAVQEVWLRRGPGAGAAAPPPVPGAGLHPSSDGPAPPMSPEFEAMLERIKSVTAAMQPPLPSPLSPPTHALSPPAARLA